MRRHLSYSIRTFIVIFAVVLCLSPVAAAQSPNPVGEWNLQSDAQGQITKFTLTITKEGDIFKGKVASEQYGAQDLKDLKVENGTITYTRNLEIAGQAVAMAFKGRIEGDKLTGAYTVQGIELPVTGTRKAATNR
jgi:hypothetical protein